MTNVFVYGSLKRGFHNYPVMEDAGGVYLGDATLPGARMYSMGAYPAIQTSDSPDDIVTGELFRVPVEHLVDTLDWLEGHPRFYKREQVHVCSTDGTVHAAWVYLYPHSVEGREPVPSGTWLALDMKGDR